MRQWCPILCKKNTLEKWSISGDLDLCLKNEKAPDTLSTEPNQGWLVILDQSTSCDAA